MNMGKDLQIITRSKVRGNIYTAVYRNNGATDHTRFNLSYDGMSLILAVNILCVLQLQAAYCEYYHAVYIDSNNGRDNETCIVGNNSSRPCQSLHWALQQDYRRSSTQFVLLNSGPHLLHEPIETFAYVSSIAFIGSEVNTTICCMAAETGLAFTDISDLVFVNISFIGCASERMSTSRNFSATNHSAFSTVQVSLYFYHCHDVSMTNVRVENPGSGATGVIMYDSDGVNTITNSYFVNCTVEPDHPGGGGFYVEFSYCVPGNTSCFNNSDDTISYESRNRGAQYHFLNCTFRQNVAKDSGKYKSTYIVANRANHEAFGRGGGLSIFVKGNASDNAFNISKCTFDSNHALWGGGFFVEFHDDTFNNTITVSQSTFSSNECRFTTHSGTGGGGIRIGHFENPQAFPVLNQIINDIILIQCNFLNNSALNGGGLSVHSSLKHKAVVNVSTIHVINGVFSENVARLGAAMYVNPFSIFNAGKTLSVYIVQCNFTNNSNQYVHRIKGFRDKPYEIGVGTVYINKVDVHFQDKLTFSYNSGSALAVVGTAVNFKSNCEADFLFNTGIEGGAIALLGVAYIQIGDNVTMKFYENKASSKGGAIYNKYIEKEDIKTDLNCFFQHENPLRNPKYWNAHFSFYGNKHQGGLWPNAIYSTSLLPCSWNGDNEISDKLIFCDKQQWNFTAECNALLSSDVGKIKYTGGGVIKNRVQAYPGKPFRLPIRVQDDLSNSIKLGQTIFSVSTNYSDASNTSTANDFAYFWGESATLNEAASKDIALKLYSIGDRVWHVEVLVDMQSCPPGFKPVQSNIETTVCNCSEDYNGALICDYGLFHSYLKNGHWMGKIPGHDDYLVGQCPPSYCASSKISMHLPLPSTEEELEKLICGEQNRRGVLCGDCLEGFGIAVNSLAYNSACVHCNQTEVNVISNVAKYVASIYIPLFFMFTILILFDIRLTTGPANAFILYCQVVASTFDLNADGQIPLNNITSISTQLLQAYQVPYGIFNLEFIENFLSPLCFGADFNMLSVLSLDYIVALFPLIMILVVVLCVKLHACIPLKCQCYRNSRFSKFSLIDRAIATRRRNIREAILPAFSAFLLLSYTKFSIVSSYLVKYQPLINENGTLVKSTTYYICRSDHLFLQQIISSKIFFTSNNRSCNVCPYNSITVVGLSIESL